MTPRASAQILPLDGSAEHLLGLLEVGSERRAEGTLRGTDLEDPKDVEEDARPLNALCKRLSEDAVSRKVRPLPGRWAAVPRPAWRHSQTHVHASIQADRQRWARTLRPAAPGQQPCEAGTACHSPGQQRAGQGLRPPLRLGPRVRMWPGMGQGLGGPHHDAGSTKPHSSVCGGVAEILGSVWLRAGGRALPCSSS